MSSDPLSYYSAHNNNTMNQQETPQVNVGFEDTEALLCDNEDCKNDVFIPVMKFRTVSGLITGTGKTSIVPVQTFQCTACGNIPNILDIQNER